MPMKAIEKPEVKKSIDPAPRAFSVSLTFFL
jgi:hypothetical protein